MDLVREDQFITCAKNGIVQGMIEYDVCWVSMRGG